MDAVEYIKEAKRLWENVDPADYLRRRSYICS